MLIWTGVKLGLREVCLNQTLNDRGHISGIEHFRPYPTCSVSREEFILSLAFFLSLNCSLLSLAERHGWKPSMKLLGLQLG